MNHSNPFGIDQKHWQYRKKIFLDCGSHHLEGINSFIDKGIITNDFEIYAFEANPTCKLFERVKKSKHLDSFFINVHEKAVWTENAYIKFNQEHHKISGSGSPSDGESDRDGWGSSVVDANMTHGGYLSQVEVPAINFSDFLSRFSHNDLIFCKLDIECSEYNVLRHLLSTGEIKKINTLFVEFHPHFTGGAETQDSTKSLVSDISSQGVNVHTGDVFHSWNKANA